MAELAFEYFLAALEATRGTAVNPPTHYLNMRGTITPREDVYEPDESTGTLDRSNRSLVTRRWSEWTVEGALDTLTLPFLACMAVRGTPVTTTPVGGTDTRLHTFVPVMTGDNLKSASLYWGDPGVMVLRSRYAMADQLVLTLDGSSTDGGMQQINGLGYFPTKTDPSDLPEQTLGPLIRPAEMQVWLDTTEAIGTTELTAVADTRVVSTTMTIPTGVTYKRLAAGPVAEGESIPGYNRTGRQKFRPECVIRLELPDADQYDVFAGNNGDTIVKLRVRAPGPIIEGALRHYVEWDIYGPLRGLEWGELVGSNRTIQFTVPGHRDATLGASFALRVQNNQATV
jgi:hypothetical protein